ncbi:MAG: MoxR family ATPase [Clostridia bacterium]|nr:MoxR family ATPase [Clostridia bacterium]
MKANECAQKLSKEVSKIYIGKEDKIKLIIMSVFAGGHVLLDDLPGSGKTVLIKTISRALGCDFQRVQFTPDLLPSDIVGMTIFDRNTNQLKQVKGPVFTNILLADEINRAIPRTQAALLEAMEEQQVTIDNTTYALPKPFFVMATENPVERESTFKLPAAQMDRFFVRLTLGFPAKEEEVLMLTNLGDEIDFSVVEAITNPEELMQIRAEIQDVIVSDNVKNYIVDLVNATRENEFLRMGGSPRASRCLYQGAKALAAINGRDYVIPEDVAEIFVHILSHRVVLTSDAVYTGKEPAEILASILENVSVPPNGKDYYGK